MSEKSYLTSFNAKLALLFSALCLLVTFSFSAVAVAQPFVEISSDIRSSAVLTKLQAETSTVAIYAKGLCCPSCAIGVRKMVKSLDFVDLKRLSEGVELDAKTQLVTIAVKKGSVVNIEMLKKAIQDAGYDPLNFYELKSGKLITKRLTM